MVALVRQQTFMGKAPLRRNSGSSTLPPPRIMERRNSEGGNSSWVPPAEAESSQVEVGPTICPPASAVGDDARSIDMDCDD